MEHLHTSLSSSDDTWRPIFSAAEVAAGQHLALPLVPRGDERRAHPRVPIMLAAEVRHGTETTVVATQDLSEAGACITTSDALPVGSEVEVDVELPNRNEPARVKAEVRWNRGGKAGLLFRSGSVAAIAAFVGSVLAAPVAMASTQAVVPQFDPDADIVLDMKAGGERPDEYAVMQAFEQQYGSFDECVAEAKNGRNKTLPGDVDVEVLLNPEGSQPLGINAKLDKSVDKHSLRECLRSAVAAAEYPAYDGPPVVVTFNFELDPGTVWEEE